MNESVSPEQRFTSAHPCWVCGGGKDYPSGSGQRCHGYESKDKKWAWCSRDEYAHGIPPNEYGLYKHRAGLCSGGVEHDNGAGEEVNGQNTAETPTPGERSRRGRKREPLARTEYPIKYSYGDVAAIHVRLDYGPKDKQFFWIDPMTGEERLPFPQKELPFYNNENLNGGRIAIACEGEKAAKAVQDVIDAKGLTHQITAVGWAGGATTMPVERSVSAFCKVKRLILWPDQDWEGKALAKHIARTAKRLGTPEIFRVNVDDLPEHADAADLSPDEIVERIEAAEVWPWDQQLSIVLERASEMKPEAVEWQWTGYIPLGGITLLDGNPGEGKTGVALDFVRRVTRGWLFPNETVLTTAKPANVIYVSGEDSPKKSLLPRLIDYEADLERITFLRFTEEKKGLRTFDFSQDLEQIKEALDADPEVKMIVIDPIQMHIGVAVDMNKMNQVRAALGPISILAEERNLAIIIVRHFTKNTNQPMMMRGGGSIDIPGIARSQLALFKTKIEANGEEKDQRYLSREKCNWYKPMDSILYDITGKPTFITWQGTVAKTGDELTAPKEDHKTKQATEAQKAVLEVLRAHRRSVVEHVEGVDEDGVSLDFIAGEVVRDKSNVRKTLAQLIGMDLVEKVRHGKYRIVVEDES